jgi:hypothetical protein
MILHIFQMEDGETREEVAQEFWPTNFIKKHLTSPHLHGIVYYIVHNQQRSRPWGDRAMPGSG